MSLRQSSLLSALDRRTATVTIVSLAALMATYLVTHAWKAIHTEWPATPRTIEVQGQAQRRVAPDHVSWTITVHGHGATEALALAKVHENVKVTHDYLAAHAIADGELSYGSETTSDLADTASAEDGTDQEAAAPAGWDATQDIAVSLGDLKRSATAHDAAAIADVLADDEVSELACSATVADSASEALIGEARKNTRTRANAALAQFGGAKLGRLVTAGIGSVEIGSECAGIMMTATASATYELQ